PRRQVARPRRDPSARLHPRAGPPRASPSRGGHAMIRRTILALSLSVLAPAPAAHANDEASPPAEAGLVDINTASFEELTTLPGIGPTKARAIVEYRERRRFPSPAAIQRVKGIGRATYLRLRPLITVGNR